LPAAEEGFVGQTLSPQARHAHAQEFFQLLMRELFDPNFGMFTLEEGTRTYWFRPSSLDLHMEFELVGLLLALAIYNNHNLEVSFPMVVYK
jgi:ubiquitin-protein ligase E3 A